MLTFDIGISLFRCATILDSYEKNDGGGNKHYKPQRRYRMRLVEVYYNG